MTKQEEFLYIVQMSALANCINLSSIPELAEKYRHVISLTGAFNIAQNTIEASKMIPEEISAVDAANDFVTYFIANQRKNEFDEIKCPYWLQK